MELIFANVMVHIPISEALAVAWGFPRDQDVSVCAHYIRPFDKGYDFHLIFAHGTLQYVNIPYYLEKSGLHLSPVAVFSKACSDIT